MKAKIFSLALAVVIATTAFTTSAQKRKRSQFNGPTKSYSKTYPAGDDKLRIDNEFGDVTVTTWDKNEFKVDVQIKVSTHGGNDQKLLDAITINDKKSGNGVFFQTHMSNSHTSGSQNIQIDYTVYMPAKSSLEISDDYGNIDLPELSGKVNIHSSYGNVDAKSLSNAGNEFNLSYSNASIASMRAAKLSSEYGNISIGSVSDLTAKLDYSALKVENLQGVGNFNAEYGGGITVNNLGRDFKKLSITSEYANINMGTKDANDADFDITIQNGSFKHDGNNVAILTTTPPTNSRGWSPTKNYKGRIGKGDPAKMIFINSQYGNVRIN